MQRIQKQWTRTFRMLVLAGVLSLSSMALAQENPLLECPESSLDGPYTYSRMGTVVGKGPAAAQGIVTFDGQGNLAGTDTASVNGLIIQRTFDGDYQMTANCTGVATLVFTDGETISLDLLLMARGEEISFIQTNDGTVITGSARKMTWAFARVAESETLIDNFCYQSAFQACLQHCGTGPYYFECFNRCDSSSRRACGIKPKPIQE
jgi:hypothetical protein